MGKRKYEVRCSIGSLQWNETIESDAVHIKESAYYFYTNGGEQIGNTQMVAMFPVDKTIIIAINETDDRK